MTQPEPSRVGYVVKRYPRYSETFIVNEILAHEAAGLDLEVYSLLPPNDTHFQDAISRVRAPVTNLGSGSPRSADLWAAIAAADDAGLDVRSILSAARDEEIRDVYPALLLAIAIRTRGIGHLHAHFATSAAAVACLGARFAGVPYTVTAHAKDIFHAGVDAADLDRKFDGAAAVVTVSEHNVAYLRRQVPRAADKIVRIYNGLDLDRFGYTAPAERRPIVLGVGRLVEKKGFADLIDACALLAARGRSFECHIIGTGPLQGELLERVEQRGLRGRVSLLGPRPQREVIDRMRSAAAFAAPCTVGTDGNRDGLPTVLLEAMALGTPCIATPVTGIPEAVVDGESGLLVPERDAEALADALDRILYDGVLRLRLASAARRRVERDFDVERNAARLRELFAVAPSRPAIPAELA